jgi:hypothetical protein
MERNTRKLVCAILVITWLSACTSLQPVYPAPDIIVQQVRAGDYVRVATHDGDTIEFKVLEIDTRKLVGKEKSVAYQDILQLEVKRFDGGETLWLLGGIALGFTVLIVAATIAAGPGMPAGPQ